MTLCAFFYRETESVELWKALARLLYFDGEVARRHDSARCVGVLSNECVAILFSILFFLLSLRWRDACHNYSNAAAAAASCVFFSSHMLFFRPIARLESKSLSFVFIIYLLHKRSPKKIITKIK